nr:uncharacterized protein LOC129276044 [Lytechinus pictus]
MSAGIEKKSEKYTSRKTRSNYKLLHDELEDNTTVPAGVEVPPQPAGNTGTELAGLLKEATSNFEKMMDKAVKTLVDSVKKVERALEFEGLRINDLEKKNVELESRLEKMEKAYETLVQKDRSRDSENNKADRLSRKNNLRVVGVEEAKDEEDCLKLVEDMLKTKFHMAVKVEKAIRTGKRGDKPRHIIVKTHAYDDKVNILKKSREALKTEKYYLTNDLTRMDLEVKRKHRKEVEELYQKGTKLRFYAGQWRNEKGVPYFTS